MINSTPLNVDFNLFLFFRENLAGEEIYGVPKVVSELSTKKVLTSELVAGVPIDQVAFLDQDDRNFVSSSCTL